MVLAQASSLDPDVKGAAAGTIICSKLSQADKEKVYEARRKRPLLVKAFFALRIRPKYFLPK